MQAGFIFKIAENIFGILTYQPQTQVLCRVTHANNVEDVCGELAQEFAGHFTAADGDQKAWAECFFRTQGAVVLTRFQGED